MLTKDHSFRSLEFISRNSPDFFLSNHCAIVRLMCGLHSWLDYFAGKDGYRDYSFMYHKERRHHSEGINEAVRKFSDEFGEDFKDLIREEARRHISDDFCGHIPSKDECDHSYIRRKQKKLAQGYID